MANSKPSNTNGTVYRVDGVTLDNPSAVGKYSNTLYRSQLRRELHPAVNTFSVLCALCSSLFWRYELVILLSVCTCFIICVYSLGIL